MSILKTQPLVSVIMPSYNQREFIERSIDSILSQSYPEIELIIADGQSEDGTIPFLEGRAKHVPNLRWTSKPDSGPAEALNRALSMTRGTIIGWLNSDDLYTQGAVERAVSYLVDHPDKLMVYGEGEHIDEHDNVLNRYPTLQPHGPIERFSDGCFICQPTVIFKRTLYVMLGELDHALGASFDMDYWLRAFKAFPDRIGFLNHVQAQSRLHDDCITMKMRKRVAVESVTVLGNHLGKAPVHWMTTYIEEALSPYKGKPVPAELLAEIRDAIERIYDFVPKSDFDVLVTNIKNLEDRLQ